MSFLDEATGTRRGRTQNDQVAESGRMEMREGLERMGRREKVNVLSPRTAASTALQDESHVRNAGHPDHHRDDAISGLPSREGQELRQQAEMSNDTTTTGVPHRRPEHI
ncbi:hypothetical protein BKA70DRAFT_1312094 [Coprinopsis sp. MPI-PUGE-AT-0042]|nr:hypothetical protein BKA70DRAFT_1312094 [Coprinopsis sp. MPI-PUGE-AT-0042]